MCSPKATSDKKRKTAETGKLTVIVYIYYSINIKQGCVKKINKKFNQMNKTETALMKLYLINKAGITAR